MNTSLYKTNTSVYIFSAPPVYLGSTLKYVLTEHNYTNLEKWSKLIKDKKLASDCTFKQKRPDYFYSSGFKKKKPLQDGLESNADVGRRIQKNYQG